MGVNASVSLVPINKLSASDLDAIRELSRAVYPPAEWVDWPGKHIEWASTEWCVCVWNEAGELVSYVGAVVRQAQHEGRPVRVGGIGGVKTHPAARGRGYAAQGIGRAIQFFREEAEVDFGLLVCEPGLIPCYSKLSWQEFGGRLLVAQQGTTTEFTFNRVMVRSIGEAAPVGGTIDLLGPPW